MEQKVAKYEAMFLLNNGRVPPEGGAAVQVVNAILAKHGANVVRTDLWAERKLAYPIAGQRRGTYVLSHFEASPDAVARLNHEVNISEDVMRWLSLRLGDEFPPFRSAAEWGDVGRSRSRREGGRDEERRGRPFDGEEAMSSDVEE